MTYDYRDLAPEDAAFLLEMLRLALGWHLVPPADGSPLPVAVPPRVFDDLGRAGDGGVVATLHGQPAGACWYRLMPYDGHELAGRPVPELTIAVVPQHRAQGVGGTLLDRGIEHARASGFAAIDLVVELENPARAMYERRGFEPAGDARAPSRMRKLLV
jgi:ribosomal protein S18 acetylase RimI-like enzyme